MIRFECVLVNADPVGKFAETGRTTKIWPSPADRNDIIISVFLFPEIVWILQHPGILCRRFGWILLHLVRVPTLRRSWRHRAKSQCLSSFSDRPLRSASKAGDRA